MGNPVIFFTVSDHWKGDRPLGILPSTAYCLFYIYNLKTGVDYAWNDDKFILRMIHSFYMK